MKLNQKSIAILVVVILFGGIFISDAAGVWQTESSKVPAKIQTGDFAGEGDPADIRGSYTLGDIEQAFPITVEILAQAFLVDENPAEFQLKTLEEMYPSEGEFELGTSSVRYFVARYTGLPYEQTGEEALFLEGIQILRQLDKISPEEAEAIPVMDSGAPLQYQGANPQAGSEDHVEPLIKGDTTIADLLALGLEDSEIVEVTGPYASKGELVRDECKANGVSFSSAKGILQEMIRE